MEPKKESKTATFLKELITFAVVALVIVVPIRLFIAQPFIVSGESMHPTFETGQYLIVDQLSYKLGDPNRGDVIVFHYPKNPSKFFIKRVIGLPGEKIKIDGTTVTILDSEKTETFELDESYVTMNRESQLETKLGESEYFVMGDNRLASLDSRVWGPLERELIVGRAYLRLLPVGKVGFLPGNVK